MELLKKSYNNEIGDYKFHFGQEGESDIGLTVVSMCIGENPRATLAELVARYSLTRGIPFLETAIALIQLKREHGLYIYTRNRENIPGYRMWIPNTGNYYAKPPSKRVF